MPAKATKRPLKTDDKRGPNERGDKAAAKPDAAERPVAPAAAVQKAAAERPATVQPAAAERSSTMPTAALAPPDLEQQIVAYQRQLAEFGQHAKALDDILAERDRKAARLRQQLDAAQAEAERLRAELHTLRETYRYIGRGVLAAANQFEAVKRWLPGTLRNILQRGR